MTILYARLNIQIPDHLDQAATAHRLEAVLHDAAIAGSTDDFEVFYIESLKVVGVAVPFVDEEPWSLFEAGQIIGYVQRCVEQSDVVGGFTFSASFVDVDGKLIDSTGGF